MNLRGELIEAGAKRRMQARWPHFGGTWETLAEHHKDNLRQEAARYLDAFLDTLEANADAVNEAALEIWRAMGDVPFDGPLVDDFITVLRPPVSSSQENPDA